MSQNPELPIAPDHLEQAAQRLLSSGLSPEEYAGRHGANVLVFSLHRHQYRDPQVTAWIHRFGQILFTPSLLSQYQEHYLTPEELEQARRGVQFE